MLEHDAPGPENITAASSQSLPDGWQRTLDGAHAPTAEVSALNEQSIEDYLDHIYAPMVGTVSYRERQEIRREMRAHLAQLIAAHEELGSDHETATRAALRQFGRPDAVARRWLDELPVETRGAWYQNPGSLFAARAFRYSARRLAVGLSLWVAGIWFLNRCPDNEVLACLYMALGVSIPVVAGYVTGRKYPEARPVRSMLLAQLVTIPFWPYVLMSLMQAAQHAEAEWGTAAILAGVSFIGLAPTGCLGAWLGARMRRTNRRSVTAR